MDTLTTRYPRLIDAGLLVIRLAAGVAGIVHGSQKLFGAFGSNVTMEGFAEKLGSMNVPAPAIAAWAAALSEFVGGLLVLVGFFPRIGAFFFMCTMLVAYSKAHGFKYTGQGGGELALNLGAMLLAIVLAGGGRFSLGEYLKIGRRGKA
jgi:putative oxidoreductase